MPSYNFRRWMGLIRGGDPTEGARALAEERRFLREHEREEVRKLIPKGTHSTVLADFAAIMHEAGAIDDRTFEAILSELRDVKGQLLGSYTEQQLTAIRGGRPVIGEVDHDFLGREV